MARHTITIPIIKSSNSVASIIRDRGSDGRYIYKDIPAISNYLYSAYIRASNTRNGMGLAWEENAIPTNKDIISVKLHIYTSFTEATSLVYKYGQFNEGSGIPSRAPSDGGYSGLTTGWNIIDLGKPTTNSVLLEGSVGWYYAYDSNDARYAKDEYWEAYSHRSPTNKPYLTVVYDDIPPGSPKSLYPTNTTLNPREIIKFSWLHQSDEGLAQKGFSLQYSTNGGGTWTTVTQTTPNEFYDMPASTLPTSGTITWRVKTTDTNNVDSGYTTVNFTLGVVPQAAPIPISPISQYIDENNPIRFEWTFVGGSQGEIQSKHDLQYSTNGGSTWTTKTVTTPNNYYELAANILPSGNITWRVRTYNNWNEVSPYSENRSFTIIGSPSLPQIISISNSAKPLITWQATGQHIYEIKIFKDSKEVVNTGSIPNSVDRTYKVNDFLADGNYIARMRIYNEYNLSSDWAEKNFSIATVKPTKPTLDINSDIYNVGIVAGDTALETYVYRDGKNIGKIKNNYFGDYTGQNNKEYDYFIRTVDINDNFNDSDIVQAKVSFKGNTIAVANKPDNFLVINKGYANPIPKSYSYGVSGNLVYFDGRKSPVAEYGGFDSREKGIRFFFDNFDKVIELEQLINVKQILLYRDSKGQNVYGTVFNISAEENWLGYEVSFTITETDRGVAYD